MFHGQPESYWVTNVTYMPGEAEVKQWKDFGPDGVHVLMRGLQKAVNPNERAYRQFYRRAASRFPPFLIRWLPNPKMDTSASTRECLLSLLSRLRSDAYLAAPVVGLTLFATIRLRC